MTRVLLLVLLALATAASGAAQPGEVDPFAGASELDRAALVAAVLERNPTLAAARSAVEAARQRVPQAQGLMDPMAFGGVAPQSAFEPIRFGFEVGAELPLPPRGVRQGRADRAAAEADAADATLAGETQDLALAASRLYDDYFEVARRQAITEEHVALLEDFQRIATARYAAGLAAQQDPLQAEAELAHLLHQRIVLAADRQTVAAELNALLHRAPDAALPPPPDELPAPPPESVVVGFAAGVAELTVEAASRRPELLAATAEVAAREAALELARREGGSAFTPMASYNSMWDDEAHRLMVGVEVSLPQLRRPRVAAAVAEAEAELGAARARQQAASDRVAAEVATAHTRVDESRHVIALYADHLLPAARDQVAAARAGFESGRVSFLAVIEAERNLRGARLGEYEALAGYHRRLAELARALGRMPGEGTTIEPEVPADASSPSEGPGGAA